MNPLENCSVCFSSGLLYILAFGSGADQKRTLCTAYAGPDPRRMAKGRLCRRIAVLLGEQEVNALLNAKELAMQVQNVTKAYAVRA